MTAGWDVFTADGDAHVVPHTDIIEHTITDDCICGPRIESVRRADGSFGWLAAHNSIDGREFTERAEPMPQELP